MTHYRNYLARGQPIFRSPSPQHALAASARNVAQKGGLQRERSCDELSGSNRLWIPLLQVQHPQITLQGTKTNKHSGPYSGEVRNFLHAGRRSLQINPPKSSLLIRVLFFDIFSPHPRLDSPSLMLYFSN
ncbi:hypothetical protein L596_008319 [Steinernema carpocapsae]|uniref:Uncharacterized protein n=1 Tax=Steinernema carpocapsae TaxID=34508 RepID=A0A4U5PCM8_STECR|nr:hypothetical protein L596_008319 [Steinernema carpocapsae]